MGPPRGARRTRPGCGVTVLSADQRFVVEPEVPGSLGERTIMDATALPPRVDRPHLALDGWLGDPIVEVFPCFAATERAAAAVDAAGLTGVAWDPVDVTASDQFRELYPGRPLPRLRWMRITGRPGGEDFGVMADGRLVVSARALALLHEQGMRHAIVAGDVSGVPHDV